MNDADALDHLLRLLPLAFGDLVVVRLSAECTWPHHVHLDGRVGTVLSRATSLHTVDHCLVCSHPYYVSVHCLPCLVTHQAYFARSELSPAPPSPP